MICHKRFLRIAHTNIIIRIRTWRTRLHTAPARRNGLMCLPFFRERMRTQGRASDYMAVRYIITIRICTITCFPTDCVQYNACCIQGD